MNRNTVLKNISKPGRYTGGEYAQTVKDKTKVSVRWAFCFPDTYEIGMSNLGVRILYGALNEAENVWCERAYAPWGDMGDEMVKNGLPLTAHESGDPLSCFDVVAFTLQYELCYSNVLYMLSLSGIPLLASERDDSCPIIIGGGPCSYNAEPVADFFDIFSIGEGEEALCELAALIDEMKRNGTYNRRDLLYRAATELKGFYVPSLYDVAYNADGTIASYTPKDANVPQKVTKRIIEDLDKAYYPDSLIMPYIETVHDRVVTEVFRGCIRGCRFCQAGMVYRPVREKSPELLNAQTRRLWENTGFDEISLSSLSISDYSELKCLTDKLLEWTVPNKINLSLPSMRVDAFSEELMKKISTVRQSGLTFAPEAGTQRLRNVINKNVTEEDLMNTVTTAFENGRNQVKLYFMQGLPTERDEDLTGIGALAKSVVDRWYQMPNRNKARQVAVTVSVSCFIPKPFTPFQWEKQDTLDEMLRKQKVVGDGITDRKVRYNWHEAKVSHLEAVFARGDRRLSAALIEANKRGIKFDSWDECFDYDKWMDVFAAVGIDPAFYANREFGEDETLPWDVIDCGVTKKFLLDERHKAYEEATTENCRDKCSACGASKLGGCRGVCPNMKNPEPTKVDYTPKVRPIYKKLSAPKPIRLRFKKTGALQFISHLDLVRTLKTAFGRADIPIWYSEGFNPHAKLVLPLPLSIGCESICDIMEIKITADIPMPELVKRLNAEVTGELEILEAYEANSKFTEITHAEYEIRYQGEVEENFISKFTKPYVVMKRSKSGDKETDITPLIKDFKYYPNQKLLKVILNCDSANYLNPEYVAKAAGCPDYSICRTNIYRADGTEFR